MGQLTISPKSGAKPQSPASTEDQLRQSGVLAWSLTCFRTSPAEKALTHSKLAGTSAPCPAVCWWGNSSLIWIGACLWAACQACTGARAHTRSPGVQSISEQSSAAAAADAWQVQHTRICPGLETHRLCCRLVLAALFFAGLSLIMTSASLPLPLSHPHPPRHSSPQTYYLLGEDDYATGN